MKKLQILQLPFRAQVTFLFSVGRVSESCCCWCLLLIVVRHYIAHFEPSHETPHPIRQPTVGTPFEGGEFVCKLILGQDFPQVPPKGLMKTRIFHPNVSKEGEICVNTLKKDWSASHGLQHILTVCIQYIYISIYVNHFFCLNLACIFFFFLAYMGVLSVLSTQSLISNSPRLWLTIYSLLFVIFYSVVFLCFLCCYLLFFTLH